MWKLFDLTKDQMPDLSDAYYGGVKDAVYGDGALDKKTKRNKGRSSDSRI